MFLHMARRLASVVVHPTRAVEGREHRLRLNSLPLDGASSWIDRQRELLERRFDVVEDYLEERRRP
jgi:hypothetical protein